MTHLTSEKQIKLYGQLIVNFANARNTDEACTELINGIYQAFNFSSNFLEQSEKILPSLRKFESNFSKQEKVLMRLILAEKDIKGFLNTQFDLLGQYLIDYDTDKKTLTFQDIIYHPTVENGHVDADVERSKPYTIHIEDIDSHEWEMMKPWTFKEVKRLMKLGNVKKRFRQNVSKERYSEIKSQAKNYQLILAIHKQINELHNRLKRTLNEIVKTKKIYGNDGYQNFLSSYRTYCRLDIKLLPDDTFCNIADFMEEDYYLKGQENHGFRKTFAYLTEPIPFFLVEFFKQPKNKELIHICDNCGNFYISQSIRKQRFCSDKCRLAWHNRKRIESGEHRKYKRDRKYNEKVIKEKGEAPESYFGYPHVYGRFGGSPPIVSVLAIKSL
ncbi:hypothetical protein C6A36_00350 [Desulfobacteraceae bacterium SEEP-SAG10]|nr:hypothetical protein C6A36_00350 [Desulfobacteraceae bacterium SEEP-SAG10]